MDALRIPISVNISSNTPARRRFRIDSNLYILHKFLILPPNSLSKPFHTTFPTNCHLKAADNHQHHQGHDIGGVMIKILPRNTTLPTSNSKVFSTAFDGQTSAKINVFQGEKEFVSDNKFLGSFNTPRGVPQIEVTFDLVANGILYVTTIDKGTGKKQDITITGASTLPYDEVQRMVHEAEKFAKEDNERRYVNENGKVDEVVKMILGGSGAM